MPDTEPQLRVAVVGSGPSGLYAAEALVKQDRVPVTVEVLDRLPTPYGLVRYGVAPDHHKIKSVAATLATVLEHPKVRFVGGVHFGDGADEVTREDLRAHYDAVVYATGASVDRPLGVPGEQLAGSVPATALVAWYSGHPDADQPVPLDAESVAVVGVGNVAVDVARILCRTTEELHGTDVPHQVLDALDASRVREVHMLGRRGPQHAAFTPKELRELGELPGADVVVDPADLPATVPDDAPRQARANLKVLHELAGRPRQGRPRTLRLRFWCRPVELLGEERVEALRVERTRLDDAGALQGTGEVETMPAQLVLRAVGYRSLALPGLPFDERSGTVPHAEGRVLGADATPLPGEYVAGWLKRGPVGVIGTNRSDAAETVRSLLADAAADALPRTSPLPEPDTLHALLRGRGCRPVSYDGWLGIEAGEQAEGAQRGRERVKVTDWEELHRLARSSG